MSLLGITWVFGFVYAEKSTLFFAYIFIIFNGLQVSLFVRIFTLLFLISKKDIQEKHVCFSPSYGYLINLSTEFRLS